MGSHSIDYLADLDPELDLDLDFSLNFPAVPSPLENDLSAFTQMDFYDVFTKDTPSQNSFAKEIAPKQEIVDDAAFDHASLLAMSPSSSLTTSPVTSDIFEPVDASQSSHSLDEVFHDKRKRNTAALARFRIKKKMKEQALHDKARELTDRLQSLEAKLRAVEMENKCLRTMILQKTETEGVDLVQQIKGRSIADSAPAPFSFTT